MYIYFSLQGNTWGVKIVERETHLFDRKASSEFPFPLFNEVENIESKSFCLGFNSFF